MRPVVAANGENLALLGEATVSVQIGKTCVQHPVLVADNLMQECLLVTDFLTNQGCIIFATICHVNSWRRNFTAGCKGGERDNGMPVGNQ